jgi:hypothetical protein
LDKLNQIFFFSGLSRKNLTAISNLLILINNISDYLYTSWKYVFEFLSLLDDLQTSPEWAEKNGFELIKEIKDEKEIRSEIEFELIHKLIENTILLSEKSLLILIECLLEVSK